MRVDGGEEDLPFGKEAGERRQADEGEHDDGNDGGDEGPLLREAASCGMVST